VQFFCIGSIVLLDRSTEYRPLFTAIILICAAAGYFFGMIFGVDYACSPPAGNLCGLAGIFIIGPLVSAFAILSIGSLILLLPRDK
jgi:hypothetical protein